MLRPRVEATGAKENNDSEHKDYLVDDSTILTTGLHFHATNTTSRKPHALRQQRSCLLVCSQTFISVANLRDPAAV